MGPPVNEPHTHSPSNTHAILECILKGDPAGGWALFEGLEFPTAEDDGWAGHCLLNLGRTAEAPAWLVRARARGFEDAGANLVAAYRLLGQLNRAQSVLESLNRTRLSTFGLALAERERGALHFTAGRLRDAAEALENAWALAVGDAVGSRVLAWFSSPLGLVLSQLGRDARASEMLASALENVPGDASRLLVSQAVCAAYAGRFEEAIRALERARVYQGTPARNQANLRYASGVIARLRGLSDDAANHQLEGAALARAGGDTQTEFFASLQLAAIATADDAFGLARAHLSRARVLADDRRMHAHLALRHGALLVRLGDDGALSALTSALEGFEELELEREIGLTHLHLAEALLRANRVSEARVRLARAVDARYALGNATVFAAELRALPATLEHLSATAQSGDYLSALLEDYRAFEGRGAAQLNLVTLGGYGLAIDGKSVRVNTGLARTVETLAYLLDHGEVTLEQIQTDVFSEASPRNARGYLHVVRQMVAKAVPGLVLPYSPDRGAYRLEHRGLRIHWDAFEVKRALQLGGELGLHRALALYTGPFLPRSDGAWAEEYRRDLEWSLAETGLRAIEDLYRLGSHAACIRLAERLLEINPLDVGTSVLLVRAEFELHGTLAARSRLDRLATVFRGQIGEVPEPIEHLGREGWLQAN